MSEKGSLFGRIIGGLSRVVGEGEVHRRPQRPKGDPRAALLAAEEKRWADARKAPAGQWWSLAGRTSMSAGHWADAATALRDAVRLHDEEHASRVLGEGEEGDEGSLGDVFSWAQPDLSRFRARVAARNARRTIEMKLNGMPYTILASAGRPRRAA